MVKRVLAAMVGALGMTSAAAADILWGINGHPIHAYPGVTIAKQLDYLKDLGLKSYRVNISDLAGAATLADLVREAKVRSIEILPVITPGNIDLKEDSVEVLYAKARKLAVALGSEFKQDIRVWELGNEMENFAIIQPCELRDDGSKYPCEWGPAGGVDASEYYGPRWRKVSAVLKGLSDGMIEVDPGIRKAIGTAGWGHLGAFDRMRADSIEWDISVWHAYGQDPEWAFKIIAGYGRPIWLTEFNSPNGSQYDEQQQADGLKQAIVRLRQLQSKYKIEAAHVYELLDETYWAPSSEAYMGLVHLKEKPGGGWTAGEPKPAYFAVRDMVGRASSSAKATSACSLVDDAKIAALPARQVRYSFCLILGHAPDQKDFDAWVAALESGETTLSRLLLANLRSDEYHERHPTSALTDTAYVEALYPALLGREADSAGVDSYVREMKDGAMTRADIALALIRSSEFRSKHPALFKTEGSAEASPAGPPG